MQLYLSHLMNAHNGTAYLTSGRYSVCCVLVWSSKERMGRNYEKNIVDGVEASWTCAGLVLAYLLFCKGYRGTAI